MATPTKPLVAEIEREKIMYVKGNIDRPLTETEQKYYDSMMGKKDNKLDAYSDSENKFIGKDGGMKNDKGKLDWWLFPFEVFEGVVRVLMYGADKYEENNWKNVKNRRNFSALIRHLIKWKNGEEFDPESGLHHLDHALCDLMFMKYDIMVKK